MTDADRVLHITYDKIIQLYEKITKLENIIADIQYTNLRRDMNIKRRTSEIDRLCKGEPK